MTETITFKEEPASGESFQSRFKNAQQTVEFGLNLLDDDGSDEQGVAEKKAMVADKLNELKDLKKENPDKWLPEHDKKLDQLDGRAKRERIEVATDEVLLTFSN